MTEKLNSTQAAVAAQARKSKPDLADESAFSWTGNGSLGGSSSGSEAILVAALLGVSRERAAEALKAMRYDRADG